MIIIAAVAVQMVIGFNGRLFLPWRISMLYKNTIVLVCMTFLFFCASASAKEETCSITLSLSAEVVKKDHIVFFSINNKDGFSKALTIPGHASSQLVDNIKCSKIPYTISASWFDSRTSSGSAAKPIDLCRLKMLILSDPAHKISLVFPKDFNCSIYK